ncbi:MAG: DUF2752 domain-containing protein [Luteolibacter sp.]
MHRDRACWVACGVFGLAFAAFWLRENGPYRANGLPSCIFHHLTGLHCAGCGMTRAAYATLHGRLGEAFRLNPLGMVLLPVASLGVGLEIFGWMRGCPPPFRMTFGKYGAWALGVTILGFWALRNVPAWPFTLLAPP